MSDLPSDSRKTDLLRLTAEVAAAYFGKNTVAMPQVPELIRAVYTSLRGVSGHASDVEVASPASNESGKPAVPVKKSITPEYLVCLEDGKRLKMLKRHLRTVYNLTPEQYRAKWNLPSDYPMVAPKYAEQRSAFAKKIGLGRGTTSRRAGRGKRAAAT